MTDMHVSARKGVKLSTLCEILRVNDAGGLTAPEDDIASNAQHQVATNT